MGITFKRSSISAPSRISYSSSPSRSGGCPPNAMCNPNVYGQFKPKPKYVNPNIGSNGKLYSSPEEAIRNNTVGYSKNNPINVKSNIQFNIPKPHSIKGGGFVIRKSEPWELNPIRPSPIPNNESIRSRERRNLLNYLNYTVEQRQQQSNNIPPFSKPNNDFYNNPFDKYKKKKRI